MPDKTALEQRTIHTLDDPQEAVMAYLVDCRIRNLAAGTVRFYEFKLRLFLDYCDGQQITMLSQVDTAFMRSFFLKMQERHNPGGQHAIYRAVKSFLSWYELETGNPSPMKRIHAPRLVLPPLSPADPADVAKMLQYCDKRDRAIILVLIDTGVRASELLALQPSDLDLVHAKITIRHGKGGKSRVVFVGQKTRRALRDYLRTFEGDGALFPLTYTGLRMMLKRRCKDAGIEYQSPHSFRRAFALSMLRNGADVYSIQELMGHSDLQILRRYLKQTDDDLRTAHARASPADRL